MFRAEFCCELAAELFGDPSGEAFAVLGAEFPCCSTGRIMFLVARRVGRTVHFRFLLAHRLHGNFLSHLVLVFAQLLQAMGVLPADLGMMPLEAERGSWFPSLPWTV